MVGTVVSLVAEHRPSRVVALALLAETLTAAEAVDLAGRILHRLTTDEAVEAIAEVKDVEAVIDGLIARSAT